PPTPPPTLFPYTTLFRSSPTDTPTPLNPRSPIPQNKVAVLHNTPESSRTVDLRNKLDYKLARFSTLAESAPIVGITLKEFLAIRSEEHTSELQSPYDLVC